MPCTGCLERVLGVESRCLLERRRQLWVDRVLAPVLRAVVVAGALAIAATVLLGGGMASASTRALPKAMVGCWHRHAAALPVETSAGVFG